MKKQNRLKNPLELQAMNKKEIYEYIDKLHSVLMKYQDVIEYSEGKSEQFRY